MQRVLIVGGTGRAGGAAAAALVEADEGVEVRLGGRNRETGETTAAAIGERASYVPVDLTDPATLRDALDGSDLVIHTAGPFQDGEPAVLAAAVEAGVPYTDVADDIGYARRAKRLHDDARTAGLPAITTGGLFPGVSNVMVAELLEGAGPTKSVAFSYWVAGSGGAGPTVLTSTLLIASEPATEYVDGERREHHAFTGRQKADFPPPVGRRPVYHFELPEVSSVREVFGVPNVSARFGTSPDLWNLATALAGRLRPRSLFRDRRRITRLVDRSGPAIRLVNRWAGSAVAMRVDVTGPDGRRRTATYVHPECIAAIGTGVAMFGLEVLAGRVPPGVWYPEEAIRESAKFLEGASAGASLDLGTDG